jgi:SAM-dependent methyltransferase
MRRDHVLKDDYLQAQKAFWNVDEHTARFGRVDTVSHSEEQYECLADRDIGLVLEGINTQRDWTILEIGCGVGRLLKPLVHRVCPAKAIGVDIAENMIHYARTALADLGNVELLVNTGADLSMISGSSIDFVYSNDVFIHIHDTEVVRSYFREVSRVLKPGGFFRFNTRRMDINSAFSNSPGGLLAKAGYISGILSPLSRGKPEQGFSGIHYRKRDIQRLIGAASLSLASIQPFDGPDEKKFWCTCRKR